MEGEGGIINFVKLPPYSEKQMSVWLNILCMKTEHYLYDCSTCTHNFDLRFCSVLCYLSI